MEWMKISNISFFVERSCLNKAVFSSLAEKKHPQAYFLNKKKNHVRNFGFFLSHVLFSFWDYASHN